MALLPLKLKLFAHNPAGAVPVFVTVFGVVVDDTGILTTSLVVAGLASFCLTRPRTVSVPTPGAVGGLVATPLGVYW